MVILKVNRASKPPGISCPNASAIAEINRLMTIVFFMPNLAARKPPAVLPEAKAIVATIIRRSVFFQEKAIAIPARERMITTAKHRKIRGSSF